jgi:hypothetical protein
MRSDERLGLMPVLAPGYHRHPRDGACFTEVAAVLSTQLWTDHPSCTPPALAQLARGVNDATSAQERAQLAPLIPWAMGAQRPWSDLTSDAAVIAALMPLARCQEGPEDALDLLLHRLERQPRPRHLLDRIGWRRAARQLVRAQLRFITSTAAGLARDERLRELLVTAINVNRAVEGLPSMPEPLEAPRVGPRLLPVVTSLIRRGEVLDLHVQPVIERWPDWIREPWHQRRLELSALTVTPGKGVLPGTLDALAGVLAATGATSPAAEAVRAWPSGHWLR